MRGLHSGKGIVFFLLVCLLVIFSSTVSFADEISITNTHGSNYDNSQDVDRVSDEEFAEKNDVNLDCATTPDVKVELTNGDAGGEGSSYESEEKVVEETVEKKTVSEATVTTEDSETEVNSYTVETDNWTKKTVEGAEGEWTTTVYVDPEDDKNIGEIISKDNIDIDGETRVIYKGTDGVTIEQDGGEFSVTHDDHENQTIDETANDVAVVNIFIKDIKEITNKDTDKVIEHTRIKKDGKYIDKYTIVDEDGEERTIYQKDSYDYNYEDHLKYYEWWVRNVDNTEMYGDYDYHHLVNLDRGVGKTTVTFKDYGRHYFRVRPVYRRERWIMVAHYWSSSWTDENGVSHESHGVTYERQDLPDIDPIYGNFEFYGPVLVPLVCDECPGVYICIGDGCEDDCASQVGVVCDEAHSPEITIEDRTELVK